MRRTVLYHDNLPIPEALDRALAVLENSYNPYSNFYVGACLVSRDQNNDFAFTTGTNYENAAYGSTICAERSAILTANSQGIRNHELIAVIGKGKNFDVTEITGPCGSCRQVIYEAAEVAETDILVVMTTTKLDKIIIKSISELLPYAFDPFSLGIHLD